MVAANNGPVNPVEVLIMYVTRTDIMNNGDGEDYLFPAMRRKPGKGGLEIHDDIPVPYSTMRAAVMRECAAVGIDVKKMGTHSCRIGRAKGTREERLG